MIKNYISNHTGMLIRFDDVAENMNWYLMGKCEELFKKYNIKPLLGVIPNNQDQELLVEKRNNEFWTKVRQWKSMGWEIAMHGYSHFYDSTAHKKKIILSMEVDLNFTLILLKNKKFAYKKD